MPVGVPDQSGRTNDFTLTKTQLITLAHKLIGVLEPGQVLDADQFDDGAQLLGLIVREVDASGRWKWTIQQAAHLALAANTAHYTANNGLPTDILELESVIYRDSQGFDSPPLKILTAKQYEAIADKVSIGQPEEVFLSLEEHPENRLLAIHPMLASVAVQSEVLGDDTLAYHCIHQHMADLTSIPIAGPNWRLFWAPGALNPTAWVTGTTYTAAEQLRLLYRRPIFDFVNADDTPDFPRAWPRLLVYKLCFDLGNLYGITLEERQFMSAVAKGSYDDIFASTKQKSTTYHNKASFF